jgi:hypothetical protein
MPLLCVQSNKLLHNQRSTRRLLLSYNRSMKGDWHITCTVVKFTGMLLAGSEMWQGRCRSSPLTVHLISADLSTNACQSLIFPIQTIPLAFSKYQMDIFSLSS